MLKCMNCGHQNAYGSVECGACTIPLTSINTVDINPASSNSTGNHQARPNAAVCRNCGTSNPATAASCVHCGVSLQSMVNPARPHKSLNLN